MLNSDELINKVKVYNKFLNPERLDKAYNFAVKAHQNQATPGTAFCVVQLRVQHRLNQRFWNQI